MSVVDFKIKNVKFHTDDVYQIIVENGHDNIKAGQFYGIKLKDESKILRRPISVNRRDENELSFLIKKHGKGTTQMMDLKIGEMLNVMGPLGNGFDLEILNDKSHVLLYGGGIGIAPLLQLGMDIRNRYPNIKITTILGFKDYPYQIEEFKSFTSDLRIFIEDTLNDNKYLNDNKTQYIYGKYPTEYFMELLSENTLDHIFTCGPEPMMKCIVETVKSMNIEKTPKIQVSLEERMACGIGACLCCTKVINENQGICVCKDGPVFDGMEVY